MDKNTHYVITVETDGKYYASAITINNCNNLVGILQKNVKSMNACDSLKAAKEVAEEWNKGYKRDGIFLYA